MSAIVTVSGRISVRSEDASARTLGATRTAGSTEPDADENYGIRVSRVINIFNGFSVNKAPPPDPFAEGNQE